MTVSPDQLRASLRAVPFVPFRIHLVDQRSFDVPHPEFAALSTSGRTAYAFATGSDVAELIDTALIVSLSPMGGSASGSRAA
jgi:hypothetical protein